MSPIPESEAKDTFFFGSEENIKMFFNHDIATDEKKELRVNLESTKAELALFLKKGVNFKNRLEQYPTGNKESGVIYHTIFITNEQQGVYLELTSEEPFSTDDPKTMLRIANDKIFHRFGEEANRKYIESLLNG